MLTENGSRRPRPIEWWLRPHFFLLFVVIPILFVASALDFSRVEAWNSYLRIEYVVLFATFVGIAAVCSYLFSSNVHYATEQYSYSIRPGYLDFCAICAIAAHLIWFRQIFLFFDFSLITAALAGKAQFVKAYIQTIPGITTLTQVSIVFSCFYAINRYQSTESKLSTRHHVYFIVLLFFVVFRAGVWEERIAVIEFLLPFLVIYLRALTQRPIKRYLARSLSLGPLIAIPALLIVFAIFEYSRSWQFYGATFDGTYVEFALYRFALYYATSINNGAGLLETYGFANFDFTFLLRWLYRLPFGIGSSFIDWFGANADPLRSLLDANLSPEFNTFSGVYPIFYDLGIPLGIIFAAIYGSIFGLCYRSFVLGSGFGSALYPVMYVALLDLVRTDYLFNGRFVYTLIFLWIGFTLFRSQPSTHLATSPTDKGTKIELPDNRGSDLASDIRPSRKRR